VECKSGHVTSGNITPSTNAGMYSDLQDKFDKYVQCRYYTYAVFFKSEVIPALLIVVTPSGHTKHTVLFREKIEVLVEKTEEHAKKGCTKRLQQNGEFKVRDFSTFDEDDLEIYRY